MERGGDEPVLRSAVKTAALQRDSLDSAAAGVDVNGVGELYLTPRAGRKRPQGVKDVGGQEVSADAGAV